MRQPFSVTLRGQSQYNNFGTTWVTENVITGYASENPFGVSRRKPTGWIPPTSYSFDRLVQRRGYGACEMQQYYANGTPISGGFMKHRGNLYYDATTGFHTIDQIIPIVDRRPTTNQYNTALIDARLGMKSGNLNLGVAFAERNRTAQLVGDTALSLVNSVRALRRGDWRKAGRELGITNPRKPRGSSLPQKWLEYQYGWKPLLADVYASADALSQRPREDWIVTSKGVVRERVDRVNTVRNQYFIAEDVVKGWRGHYVRIDAVPGNDLLMSFASLGVTNPLLVGWELVPFSFIVDWMVPIGDWIGSLDAMLGYKETYFSSSAFSKTDVTRSLTEGVVPWSLPSLNYNVVKANCEPCFTKEVYLRRGAGNDVPLPFQPRIKDPRSLGHMANALSLLAGAFGSSRRLR